MKLTFIFFKGCPNAEIVKTNLANTNYPFEEICQDHLPTEHPMKQYSSPSILMNGKLLFGSKLKGSGCSIEIPSTATILEKITSLKS